MISYVVPTLWRYPPFPDFLLDVCEHPLVSDVVLINNQADQTPDHPVIHHPKINHQSFGRNIFVNPAWNLGVAASKSDIICIANDDIIFDLRVFKRIQEHMTPERGTYGVSSSTPVDGDIWFEPHTNQSVFGFGQLFFVHRQNWCMIPAELNIYYGDNFVFDTHKSRLGTNYLIKNLFHYTPYATSSKDFRHRLDPEHPVYARVLEEWRMASIHN